MTRDARVDRPHHESTPATRACPERPRLFRGRLLQSMPFQLCHSLALALCHRRTPRLRALCAGRAHCRATLPRVQSAGTGAGPLALLFHCHVASGRTPGRRTSPRFPRPLPARRRPLNRMGAPGGNHLGTLGLPPAGWARTRPVLPCGFQEPCPSRRPWGSSAFGSPTF